jgi:nucleoid-associated protein YgaU
MARLLALLLTAALGVAGWVAWSGLDIVPAPQVAEQAVPPAVTPEAEVPEALPEPTEPPSVDVVEQPPAERIAPRFDVVRVERDDSAMVAGVAEPDSTVDVLVDGKKVGSFGTDSQGNFAGFLTLPRSDDIRRLDVTARAGDGTETAGRDPIFVSATSEDADEPEAPMVVAAREEGVELMQEPQRADDETVTLDLVSYQPRGVIAASGRGNVLRLVRIYANAQLVAETLVDDDGRWSIEASATLPPGEHTLRVDEIAQDGSVTSRVEAPFIGVSETGPTLGPGEVRVERGETLWRLAEKAYGDGLRFTTIYRANTDRIRDPDLIFPGQILTIPSAGITP